MSAADVSNECVDICFTEREGLIKRCMNNALDNMHRGSSEQVPSDSTIFSYFPSKDRFVDYASQIMRIETSPKDIMKAMMVPILERFARLSRNKKRITFDPEEDDDDPIGSVSGPIIEPVMEPSRNKRPRLTRAGTPASPKSSRGTRAKKSTRTTRITKGIMDTKDTNETKETKETKDTRGSRIAKRTRSCLSQVAKEQEDEEEMDVVPSPSPVQDEEDMVTEPDEHEYQDCEEVEEVQDTGVIESDGNFSGDESAGSAEVMTEGTTIPPNLPVPLGHTSSGSMTVVSNEFFPEAEFVFPGIYILPGDSGYVLFCVDNGRYSNSWDHRNNVTTLTWVTASKDKSRTALKAISDSRNVFVFRKISGETAFRYMGKVFRSGNMDRRAGTVELAVC